MANSLSTFEEIINAIMFLKNSDRSTRDAVLGTTRAIATSNVSIASRARLNICQFPLLTSNIISVNSYRKVSEILEQLYAQYLKLMIVNQTEVINLGKGENKFSILNKIHQNDNALSTYLDRTKEEMLRSSIESRFEDALPFLEMYNFSSTDLINANKKLLKPYNENFNLSNLNSNEVLSEASDDSELNAKSLQERYNELIASLNMVNAKIDEIDSILERDKTDNGLSLPEINKLENERHVLTENKKAILKEIDEVMNILKDIANKNTIDAKAQERADKALEARKRQEEIKEIADFRRAFGSVTDFENATIKKNNSLEPSILSFTLKYHTKGGSFDTTSMSLAVKTITHMISSEELCFYINETLAKNKKVFKAIQLLTGEKEFSLRFLLGLDKAKRDAKADSTTAKWWRHLQERRTASWIRAFRHKDPYLPNATIILSKEDHSTLKLLYKKDLINNVKDAYKLTDLLFLMHIVIVDDVSNEIMIFNKDDKNWETYTLDKLQGEINTMNKMSSNITNNRSSLR